MRSKSMALLTQEYLKVCFDYSPETGVLTWRARPSEHFPSQQGYNVFNTRFAGKAAGSLTSNGYLQVRINGKLFLVHRIIYKWLHDEEPEQIDHKNHIRDGNWQDNLRAATNKINHMNQNRPSNNTSGVMGVSWCKRDKKWVAQIQADGKKINLGGFVDIEDAIRVRQEAEVEHGFHANHGRN